MSELVKVAFPDPATPADADPSISIAALLRVLDDYGFSLIHSPVVVAEAIGPGARLERAARVGARLCGLSDDVVDGEAWRQLMAHVNYFGSLNFAGVKAIEPRFLPALEIGQSVLAAADAHTATLAGQIVRVWRRS